MTTNTKLWNQRSPHAPANLKYGYGDLLPSIELYKDLDRSLDEFLLTPENIKNMKTSFPPAKVQSRPTANVQSFIFSYGTHSCAHVEAPIDKKSNFEKISTSATLKTKEYEPISQSRTSDVIPTKPVPIPSSSKANPPEQIIAPSQSSGRTSPPTRQPPKKHQTIPPHSSKKINRPAQVSHSAPATNSRSNPVPIKPNARQRRPSLHNSPPSPTTERWAGPAYHKSPAPKQLPIPTFTDSPGAKMKLDFDQGVGEQIVISQQITSEAVAPQTARSNEELTRVSNQLKAMLNIPVSS